MKKSIVVIILTGLLALAVCFTLLISCNGDYGNSRVTNDEAEKASEGRYLTIINATDQIINEVHVTVGEGAEIEAAYQENPDETSFSVKIPDEYEEYDTFTVTLIDRYGLKYQAIVDNVEINGRKDVRITEENYVRQKGDFWRKIEQFFNGD